ncbi:MAG: dephospho-CoA kinase [Succinivibrio sp.]
MQRIPGPYRVVLTGGIACGKTVISDDFRALGAEVIDTDVISRELSRPGSPMLGRIAASLGPSALRGDGSLDRRAVREMVFADKRKLEALNAITHPAIMGEAMRRACQARGHYVIMAVPLYFESGRGGYADRVLVADCPPEVQLSRLMARDGSSEETARAMIASQASRQERRAGADDLIDTGSLTLDEIRTAVLHLHEKYQSL